ncbi:hypothetical protein [Prauserella flavalba]|uniref:hypothetical protein n=1 Tax=Prauserella flavalba TaxID=1477506 RepID=UPI0036E5D477
MAAAKIRARVDGGPVGGASDTPSVGVLGAEDTARFKGAELNPGTYLGLLGLGDQ